MTEEQPEVMKVAGSALQKGGAPMISDPRAIGYAAFLEQKHRVIHPQGVPVDDDAINGILFPFQRRLVAWAGRKGRAALFCDTGLGKTFMQMEWARLIGGRALIIAPLAVAQQTVAEGRKLGLDVTYARSQDDASDGITITNYEMFHAFKPSAFGAVVLDESSILKSFDGKTRGRLIEAFSATPYRLCCTATPAPNDFEEFGNHAEFLGVCSRRDMLATFFVHKDTGWVIKGHAVEAFYAWLASWAMMVKLPSDIGFRDDGFALPPLSVAPAWVEDNSQAIAQAEGRLFYQGLHGVTGRAAARRSAVPAKVDGAAAILQASGEQWVVWCGLNDEAAELTKRVTGAVNVQGSDSLDRKAGAIAAFLAGEIRVLVTKPRIAGFGLNLQRCHRMMFVGLSDSYEQYYQAIRRCWRFGQESPVDVRVVLSHMEAPVLENVLKKEAMVQQASRRMIDSMAGYERQELGTANGRHDGELPQADVVGEGWRMLLGDCVERLSAIAPDSVDFSVFSPPFLNLYSYSDSVRDLGNSRGDEDFFIHFGYIVDGLMRVLKPGRIVACHVAQVPTSLVAEGVIGLNDFRGKTIAAFRAGGWVHHGEVVIDKDPQAQAIRTHAKGLLFVQLHKDASWMRPGIPDYILLFRKPGENQVSIHPDIDNDEWIEWARPIWYGISESDTLNVAEARTEKDEKHIAPLQLGTIERCVRLWSNPGELVLSPFAGIGSEGYQSLLLGRRFVGIELKPEYYAVACRNMERAVTKTKQGRLWPPEPGATPAPQPMDMEHDNGVA